MTDESQLSRLRAVNSKHALKAYKTGDFEIKQESSLCLEWHGQQEAVFAVLVSLLS